MRRVLIAAICAGLAGCANRHYAINDSRMSVADIVNHVQCEVKRGWEKYAQATRGEDWFATVSLSMQETLVNGANPSVTRNLAFHDDLVRTSATGGLAFAATNMEIKRFEFAININKIDSSICALASSMVKGDIGISQVIDEGLYALKFQPYSQSLDVTEAKQFGKSVQFTVTKGITGVGVTWTFRRFVGPGGLLGVSKTDINLIDINFGKKAQDENEKQAVKRTQDSAYKREVQRLIGPAATY